MQREGAVEIETLEVIEGEMSLGNCLKRSDKRGKEEGCVSSAEIPGVESMCAP